MPRKTFTAGEVLAAADVNNFLMDQSVMTFADSDARGSAIPTPSEGMVTYLEDTNDLQFFDGTDFINVGGASITPGLEHIRTETFSAVSSVTLNDIFSADYDNYKFIIRAIGSAADVAVGVRWRVAGADDTSATYFRQRLIVEDASANASRLTSQTSAEFAIQPQRDTIMTGEIFSPFLAKTTQTRASSAFITAANSTRFVDISTWHNETTSYTGMTIIPTSGNLTGKLEIWGYKGL